MNILVIGDTHIPFEHKHYLDFCWQTYKRFKCSTAVHIGDLVDNNGISYHERNPNGYSPEAEYRKGLETLKKWKKAFKELYICKGNHDILLRRQAITKGIPDIYTKSFEEVWEFPPGWSYEWKHFFLGICFEHGTGYGGTYPQAKARDKNRCKTAIGHCHSRAGDIWSANDQDCIWGLSVGCGIDRMKYPFWYSRDFKDKPVLGCGIILDDGHEPHFIKMRKV